LLMYTIIFLPFMGFCIVT